MAIIFLFIVGLTSLPPQLRNCWERVGGGFDLASNRFTQRPILFVLCDRCDFSFPLPGLFLLSSGGERVLQGKVRLEPLFPPSFGLSLPFLAGNFLSQGRLWWVSGCLLLRCFVSWLAFLIYSYLQGVAVSCFEGS